jgi:8-oxo-dGTP diphosphatase
MNSATSDVRSEITNVIASIVPYDSLEKTQLHETLSWIQANIEIFRIKKPDVPDKHLVAYFCLCDWQKKKILLTEHKKSGLWLPSCGHVETDEHPKTTAIREAAEELGISARFWREAPIFITSTNQIRI